MNGMRICHSEALAVSEVYQGWLAKGAKSGHILDNFYSLLHEKKAFGASIAKGNGMAA